MKIKKRKESIFKDGQKRTVEFVTSVVELIPND
jgi:hypothetical protein